MRKRSTPSFFARAAQLLRRFLPSSGAARKPELQPLVAEAPLRGDHVNDRVRWVASAIADTDEFRDRAGAAAAELGPATIDHLATLFHGEHSPPAELANQFQGLGAWMTARQFAIFEIFYHFGADALPVLQRVAYGEYDWTQGNAIEILCRLAADDIRGEQIIAGLVEHLPAMREEAHFYALGPLLHQSTSNAALKRVLLQLLSVSEFKQSHDYIISSQNNA